MRGVGQGIHMIQAPAVHGARPLTYFRLSPKTFLSRSVVLATGFSRHSRIEAWILEQAGIEQPGEMKEGLRLVK